MRTIKCDVCVEALSDEEDGEEFYIVKAFSSKTVGTKGKLDLCKKCWEELKEGKKGK